MSETETTTATANRETAMQRREIENAWGETITLKAGAKVDYEDPICFYVNDFPCVVAELVEEDSGVLVTCPNGQTVKVDPMRLRERGRGDV